MCGETQGKPLGHKGGDFVEVAVDVFNAEIKLEQKCTECGEVTEEKTEKLEILCRDGKFLFSPEEFWEGYENKYGSWYERPDCSFMNEAISLPLGDSSRDVTFICQGSPLMSLANANDIDETIEKLAELATSFSRLITVCCPGAEYDIIVPQVAELLWEALYSGKVYIEATISGLGLTVYQVELGNSFIFTVSLYAV